MTTTHTSRTGTFPEEGIKAPCKISASTNLTLSGEQTIGGVSCVSGDRVCARGQSSSSENGIWICSTGSWTRSSDWSDARDVVSGVQVIDAHNKTSYIAIFTGDFVAGTTSITFTLMAAATDFEPTIEVTVGTLSIASGDVEIDLSSNTKFYQLTLSDNVVTWSYLNLPAAGKCKEIEIEITQNASVAKTCASPATSGCTAGGVWVQDVLVGAKEVLGLRIFSDGTVHLFPSGVFE